MTLLMITFLGQEANGVEQWLQTLNTPTLLTLFFGAAVVIFFIARQLRSVQTNSLDTALADNSRLRERIDALEADKEDLQGRLDEQIEKRRSDGRQFHLDKMALESENAALKRRLGE